jgi:carboxypeptidase PM20D1
MPAKLTAPVKAMLESLGRQGVFAYRLLFLNAWITKPILLWVFSKNPPLNALGRTTVVPTMIEASDKSNVIAEQATAMVNVRLLPTQTQEEVLGWMKKVIGDPAVKLKVVRFTPASEVSPAEGEAFSHLASTITACFRDAVVTPYLMLGATDARKYQNLSNHIYRFTPVRMDKSEVGRMHGVDERISEENIQLAVTFYATLVQS